MEIDVDEEYNMIAKKVYNPLILETSEGNKVAICMRDDTFEITVPGSDRHFRVDVETGNIYEM